VVQRGAPPLLPPRPPRPTSRHRLAFKSSLVAVEQRLGAGRSPTVRDPWPPVALEPGRFKSTAGFEIFLLAFGAYQQLCVCSRCTGGRRDHPPIPSRPTRCTSSRGRARGAKAFADGRAEIGVAAWRNRAAWRQRDGRSRCRRMYGGPRDSVATCTPRVRWAGMLRGVCGERQAGRRPERGGRWPKRYAGAVVCAYRWCRAEPRRVGSGAQQITIWGGAGCPCVGSAMAQGCARLGLRGGVVQWRACTHARCHPPPSAGAHAAQALF
jgi:hypothetical protein